MKKHALYATLMVLLLIVAGCASHQGSHSVNKHRVKANNNANPVIYGNLYEYGTKDPAIAGTVMEDKQIKSYAVSRSGKYQFNIEPGKHKFEGIAIGYYPTTTRKVKVIEGDSVRIDFYLKVNATPLHN